MFRDLQICDYLGEVNWQNRLYGLDLDHDGIESLERRRTSHAVRELQPLVENREYIDSVHYEGEKLGSWVGCRRSGHDGR